MKKIFVLIGLLALLVISAPAQASLVTYSIIDYPAYQADTQVTGQTDHVSGTIMADPDTGVISSASFTITGATSYTVSSATIDTYYVHISPTQITVDWNNPTNSNGYGNLRLSGSPSGSPAFDNAALQWYSPSYPWQAGNNTIASYTGSVYNNSGKARGADFGTSVTLYPPQHPSTDYPTWIVATAVPIPGAVWLLGSGLVGLVGLRRKMNR